MVKVGKEMENKENLQNEDVLDEAFSQDCIKDLNINVAELTEEEAKNMLEEVLSANKEIRASLDKANEELKKSKDESTANKDSWYRTAAEFENFKKRNKDSYNQALFDGKKEAIVSLLIIGDSVDRALSVIVDEKTKEGVMLIKRQFDETLKALSVEEINPVGQSFDPQECEAVSTVKAAEGEKIDTVKSVYKKGYKLNGKILRYAQVIVIK